ncbi:MAG: hypothetical protein C4522_09825 [Desulfobacteraceae bacterium]|nr:MAG: hypothetical protein C4522_09825 [Desulfobacteraceae bacterium]
MRTVFSQYYGRGGARLHMPRPRIEPEAWNQDRRKVFGDRLIFIQRIPALLFQTRFMNILAVILAIVLFNYWLSIHYYRESHPDKKKIVQDRKLKLVLQYSAAPEKIIPKPQPAEKPQPQSLPPQPVAEQLKPVPKSVDQPEPAPKPTPKPKPKPVRKRELDFEAGLNMDKEFELPGMNTKTYTDEHVPTVKQQEARKAEVGNGLVPTMPDLALDAADNNRDMVSTSSQATRMPSVKNRQPNYNEGEEITVAVQKTERYQYPEAQAGPDNPMLPVTTRAGIKQPDKDPAEIQFAESGVSLIQLKACGPVEEAIKIKLAALVKKNGYPKECIDKTGIYRFYWPSERFTVQHFNVIIFTSQGRMATDRCEELTNACECLENN